MNPGLIHYLINEQGQVVIERNFFTWAEMYPACRRVEETTILDTRVSTIFLGLDHNFGPTGPPLLWETMIFGGPLDTQFRRCSGSREQALAMHAEMVAQVRKANEETTLPPG